MPELTLPVLKNLPPLGITSEPGERHKAITYIAIETCAHCNRACHFCPTNNTVFPPKEFLAEELLDKLLAELTTWGYAGGFSLYGHNEALLDPRLEAFTRKISEQLPQVHQSLSTNGDKLTLDRTLALYEAGLSTLLVNCYDNRQNLIERMLAIGSHLETQTGFQVNYIGSDARAFPMHTHPTIKTFNLYDARQFGEQFPGISSRAGNVAGFARLKEPLAKNCERPWTHVHIKYNGNVILCCQDWKQEVVLGNIGDSSLSEIYNCPLAEHYREKLGNRDRRGLSLCERCDWGND